MQPLRLERFRQVPEQCPHIGERAQRRDLWDDEGPGQGTRPIAAGHGAYLEELAAFPRRSKFWNCLCTSLGTGRFHALGRF